MQQERAEHATISKEETTSKLVLFISGSVGLGHARRDLAIANALRRLNPAIEILWLASNPARTLIREAGERLLPEADRLANDTTVIDEAAVGFHLDLVKYVLRAASAWDRNVAVFEEVTSKYPFDLIIGDETYEISLALEKRPELKKAPFTMIYDFVGCDVMSHNLFEWLQVYVLNWSWGGGPKGKPPTEDLNLFIGEPEDVPDRPFGLGLPNRRAYARRYYHFVGYVLGFDPVTYADRSKIRAALGYDERPLIVASIGGTAVGKDLLALCAAAYPHIRQRVENVHMILVCGPGVDPASLRIPEGVEVRGYVPRLFEHLAACDLAIVQAGGTTTLELTALQRPFIYFPLEGHFEQELTVAKRLARQQAGQKLVYSQMTPETLADMAVRLLGSQVTWSPLAANGAQRAAELITALLPVKHREVVRDVR
jgi:Glycosyltransferase family 28 C-terminal domain